MSQGGSGRSRGPAKIQGKPLLVRELNALATVISTPQAAPVIAPVIAATRLRGGNAAPMRPPTLIPEPEIPDKPQNSERQKARGQSAHKFKLTGG